MAFKQGNNPLSRKTSPMRRSPFRKEASVSMEDLKKMSAKQDAESKAQALKLPQIEKPGFDYEMDQDMSYPGGERGADYDEEGTKDGMSRKESPLNIEGGKTKHEKHLGRKLDGPDWGSHTQREAHHKGPRLSKEGFPTTPDPKAPESQEAAEKQGMSRKEAKYFGLGKDDGKSRKEDKLDKTIDQLSGKMSDKKKKRKEKKLLKTADQLGMSRKSTFGDVGKNLKTSVRSKGSVVEKATPKSKEESIADGNKKADKASKSVSDFKSKVDKQAADRKNNKTAKDAGKVDKSGRDGSNRQERKKRRAERKSIRKDKTLTSSQKTMAKQESRKKQKENVRGVKK